ncbi:MAG: cell wall-binding repeat-containing protein [Euzebya sp.]
MRATRLTLFTMLCSLAAVVGWTMPAVAVGGADIAVTLQVIDDLSDPQVFGVTIRNNGPDTAEFPTIGIDAGGQTITGHTADPQPGTRVDGVGCASDQQRLDCSFDSLAVGATIDFTVSVDVAADASLTAILTSAGTPDPNPQVNNRDVLLLRPATADLGVEASVIPEQDTAEVQITVSHQAGRPTPGSLSATVDLDQTSDGQSSDGQIPDGCQVSATGWVCDIPTMEAGGRLTMMIEVSRPEPDEPPATITLAVTPAELDDPNPDNDQVSITIEPRQATPADIRRHQGVERLRTAIAISTAAFPEGSRSAVIARADHFADALAGAPLAVDVGGPILLTSTGQLADVTAAELDRLLRPGSTVHLLGGEAALSAAVADSVAALGYQVRRHAGPNRYATSAVIAQALGSVSQVAFADGDSFADAVVAAGAMAARDGALLLTSGDRLPDETADWARTADWAVGQSAARAVPQAADLTGTTPAETSVVVAQTLFDDPSTIGLATTAAFPDALAGGPLTAAVDAPLLLSDGDRLDFAVADYLSGTSTISTAHLFGGPGALSPDIEEQVRALLTR